MKISVDIRLDILKNSKYIIFNGYVSLLRDKYDIKITTP